MFSCTLAPKRLGCEGLRSAAAVSYGESTETSSLVSLTAYLLPGAPLIACTGFVAETATFIAECAEDESDSVVQAAIKLKDAAEAVAGSINDL
jgi:hypothetical protein